MSSYKAGDLSKMLRSLTPARSPASNTVLSSQKKKTPKSVTKSGQLQKSAQNTPKGNKANSDKKMSPKILTEKLNVSRGKMTPQGKSSQSSPVKENAATEKPALNTDDNKEKKNRRSKGLFQRLSEKKKQKKEQDNLSESVSSMDSGIEKEVVADKGIKRKLEETSVKPKTSDFKKFKNLKKLKTDSSGDSESSEESSDENDGNEDISPVKEQKKSGSNDVDNSDDESSSEESDDDDGISVDKTSKELKHNIAGTNIGDNSEDSDDDESSSEDSDDVVKVGVESLTKVKDNTDDNNSDDDEDIDDEESSAEDGGDDAKVGDKTLTKIKDKISDKNNDNEDESSDGNEDSEEEDMDVSAVSGSKDDDDEEGDDDDGEEGDDDDDDDDSDGNIDEEVKPNLFDKTKKVSSEGFSPPEGIVHESLVPKGKKRKVDDSDEDEPVTKKNKGEKDTRPRRDKQAKLTDDRTIFVGNVPIKSTKKQMKKMFSEFGDVESVRFRCLPVNDPNKPKRVIAMKKEFHPDRHNCIGFVKFKSPESAAKALVMNGKEMEGLHLRVDMAARDNVRELGRSAFIGNLPFNIEEEAVMKHFSDCGEIESVRLVRDRNTCVGRGFGFINFKDSDGATFALKLNGSKLNGRNIRVQECQGQMEMQAAGKMSKNQKIEKMKSKPEKTTKDKRREKKDRKKKLKKTVPPSNVSKNPFQPVKDSSAKGQKKKSDKPSKSNPSPLQKEIQQMIDSSKSEVGESKDSSGKSVQQKKSESGHKDEGKKGKKLTQMGEKKDLTSGSPKKGNSPGQRPNFNKKKFEDKGESTGKFGNKEKFGGNKFGDKGKLDGNKFVGKGKFGGDKFGDKGKFGGNRFGGKGKFEGDKFGGNRFGGKGKFEGNKFGDKGKFGGNKFGDKGHFVNSPKPNSFNTTNAGHTPGQKKHVKFN